MAVGGGDVKGGDTIEEGRPEEQGGIFLDGGAHSLQVPGLDGSEEAAEVTARPSAAQRLSHLALPHFPSPGGSGEEEDDGGRQREPAESCCGQILKPKWPRAAF